MTKQRRENEAQRLVNATMALLKEDDYLKSRNELFEKQERKKAPRRALQRIHGTIF